MPRLHNKSQRERQERFFNLITNGEIWIDVTLKYLQEITRNGIKSVCISALRLPIHSNIQFQPSEVQKKMFQEINKHIFQFGLIKE
jgi:hypothetical protein